MFHIILIDTTNNLLYVTCIFDKLLGTFSDAHNLSNPQNVGTAH